MEFTTFLGLVLVIVVGGIVAGWAAKSLCDHATRPK
jgi:hypothetical protein